MSHPPPVPLLLALSAALFAGCGRPPEAAPAWHRVARAPLHVWSPHEGRIESRRPAILSSAFAGAATITELAPEGTAVRAGDLLAALDGSALERDIVRLRRDEALARSELETLEKARHPVELRELETAGLAAAAEAAAEDAFLKDSRELHADALVSDAELEQQRQKLLQAQARRDMVDAQLRLTREFLHPNELARARATLEAAGESLRQAEEQLRHCRIPAPVDGTVVHIPLHIGAEYRTARVGDVVYKNQPFLEIPDFSNLVVRCAIPESALASAAPGNSATVIPSAFPELRLKGRVERVGSMAQAEPGRAEWQRFFTVLIALDETDPRLRTGMTASAQILAYRHPSALSVPRRAVSWTDGAASVRVRNGAGGASPRVIRPGRATPSDLEVLEGLSEGDEVLLP